MIGPVVKSLLKESIEQLPEQAMKQESVVPALLKKGVRQEEINFSGVADNLPAKVTKQDLVKAEAARKDAFKTLTVEDPNYQWVSLDEGKANPTYREKVLQFSQGEEGSRFTSDHFKDAEDYLAHTRIFDETIDGTESRVLQEIQSDLHQKGRQTGYVKATPTEEELARGKELSAMEEAGELWENPTLDKEANELLDKFGYANEGAREHMDETIAYALSNLSEIAPKESPMEKTWLRKGIERELVDATKEGRQQLAIPISGKGTMQLNRSEGVQKWYESTVTNTAKKVAKGSNADFELKTVGDTTYAVIKPNEKSNLSFNLYANPVAGGMAAYTAYQAGATDEQVAAQLESKGFEPAEIAEVNQLVEQIAAAKTKGYSDAEIKTYLESKEVKTSNKETKPATLEQIRKMNSLETGKLTDAGFNINTAGYRVPSKTDDESRRMQLNYGFDESDVPDQGHAPNLSDGDKEKDLAYLSIMDGSLDSAKNLMKAMEVVKPTMTSVTMTDVPSFFGFEESKQRYQAATQESRMQIAKMAQQKFGITLVNPPVGIEGYEHVGPNDAGWWTQDEQGNYVEITPSIWDNIKSSALEITGSVALGYAGIKGGAALATAAGQPELAPIASFIGGAGGATAGAMLGAELDYLRSAMTLQVEMESEVAAQKALNAAELAVIGEGLGYVAIKSLGLGWKGFVRAKDYALEGNSKGAYTALKDATFMTDDEITELVTQLERTTVLKGTAEQKGIQAVALTYPGAQGLVDLASNVTKKPVGRAVKQMLGERTQDALTMSAQLTDEQVPRMLTQDLANYVSDVKANYDVVKRQATHTPRGEDFAWNYNKLGINPILESIEQNLGVAGASIADPTLAKYITQASRIRNKSQTRTFGDLIELRQLVNNYLYNGRIAKADTKGQLRGVLKNIDEAIEGGAHQVMENPKEWLKAWTDARTLYSQMKQVEKSSFYRAIFDKDGKVRALEPKDVINKLTKYMNALDGSFEAVMAKLPIAARSKYEGAVIDNWVNKYTAGDGVSNWSKISDELAQVHFTSPEGRAAKKALMEFGDVFKNDPNLATVSSNIAIPQFMQGLTSDIVAKAKFELAAGMWQNIKSNIPGSSLGRNMDLVKQVGSLLDKPLDQKLASDLAKEFFASPDDLAKIAKLQQQAAKTKATGQDVNTVKVRIYTGGKLKGSGKPVATIAPHRIATLEEVKVIADSEGLTLDSKQLDSILKAHGKLAVQSGSDRVRILK